MARIENEERELTSRCGLIAHGVKDEKIGYKIREAQLQQIPYMLVLGDREAAEGTVSVRSRRGGDLGARAVEAFLDDARREVQQKGR